MSGASGLFRVRLGETIKSPTINRCDVADGTKGRALLLSDDWLAAAVAYTQEPLPRGVFYVTEEDVVEFGLQPRVYYMALIARLNTDARGVVLDDTFKLEYVRLGEQQYQEFANLAMEMKKVENVVLTKVTKGTYSYISVSPSQIEQDATIMKSIGDRLNGLDIDSCLSLVIQNVARPISVFKELLAKQPGATQTNVPRAAVATTKPKPRLAAKPIPSSQPADETTAERVEGIENAFENNFTTEEGEDDEWE